MKLMLCILFLLIFLIIPCSILAQNKNNIQAPNLAERLGYSADAKLLIIHADDLGMSHSANKSFIDALKSGMVNSGSIMVPCPWFSEIAAYYRENPDLDLGLHLTLNSEWKHYRWRGVTSSSETPSLLDSVNYLHNNLGKIASVVDPVEAEKEIRAQVERALAFGIEPTHLDTHMGALFQTPALFGAYLRVGRDYNLPVLLVRDTFNQLPETYTSQIRPSDIFIDYLAMASPDVTEENWENFYLEIIKNLKPGVTEILLHLGYEDAEMQAAMVDHPDYGAKWRQRDFDVFTGEKMRQALKNNNVKMITWRKIGQLLKQSREGE